MQTPSGPKFALGTFSTAREAPFPGVVIGAGVIPLRALPAVSARWSEKTSMLSLLEDWDANFEALRRSLDAMLNDRVGSEPSTEHMIPSSQLTFHPPVCLPRQVFCAGANYREHVIDLIVDQAPVSRHDLTQEERRVEATRMMDERAAHGSPFVFLKAPSAITGPFDPVVLPAHARQPDWELELAAIIGKPARRVSREDALDCVAGYTIVNDITSRDLVFRRDVGALGADWVASKSAPSHLPMGPCLVPASFVGDPQDLRITLKLNGQVMQDESTADMIFGVARLVEYVSHCVQLWPGDVIATGSPAGNGTHYNRFLVPGDVMEGSITGLGTQRNVCIADSAAHGPQP